MIQKLLYFVLFVIVGLSLRERRLLMKYIGKITANFLLPVFFFLAAVDIKLDKQLLGVTFLSVLMTFTTITLTRWVSRSRVPDNLLEALTLATSWSNNGLFGIPVAAFLLGHGGENVACCWSAGSIMFFSVYVQWLKVKQINGINWREVIRGLILPPYAPAFALGFLAAFSDVFQTHFENINFGVTSWVRLITFLGGGILLGGNLRFNRNAINVPFVTLALSFRHMIAPVIVSAVFFLDLKTTRLLEPDFFWALVMMGAMPVALTPLSVHHNSHEEIRSNLAFTILLSTGLASLGLLCVIVLANNA